MDIDGDNSIKTPDAAVNAQPNINEVVDNVVNEMNKSSAEFASAKCALAIVILHKILK